MALFGSGYGFEPLAGAPWLRAMMIYYWGDIDTRGFAILDQLRSRFPQACSLLMDRDTLMARLSVIVSRVVLYAVIPAQTGNDKYCFSPACSAPP